MEILNRVNGYLRHQTTTGIQLRELDSFRGWAILGVMCSHMLAHSPEPLNYFFTNWFKHGWAGLDLFFFISGFLLFIGFGKAHYEGRPGPDLPAFYKRRALRIMPAYYINLLVLALFAGTLLFPASSHSGPLDIAKHVLFVHNLWVESTYSINGPLWTLAVELQYYLILPFIASWFYGRRAVIALLVIFAASAGYRLWVTMLIPEELGSLYMMEMATSLLPGRLSQFAVGMFFASVWLALKDDRDSRYEFLRNKHLANIGVLLGLLACFLLLYVRRYYHDVSGNGLFVLMSVWSGLFAFACGLLVISTIYSSSPKILLANPVIEFLGIISYSVYLWHYPVIAGLEHYLPSLGLRPNALVTSFMAGTAMLSVAVGTLSYLVLERPFLKRRLKRMPGG